MRSLPCLALLTALTLAACGKESPNATDTATSTEPTPTPTTTVTVPPTATVTPTPTPPGDPTHDQAGDQIPVGLERDLVFAGEAWLRLARGRTGPGLPVDTPVTAYLGGEEAITFDAAEVDDPQTWAGLCDAAGEGYAMRECPISALPYFEPPGIEFTIEPAQEPCSKPNPPEELAIYRRVTLVAAGDRSCLDYAAVELYVNDVAQLVAVNLVLGSP